jgi:hypothetical protein
MSRGLGWVQRKALGIIAEGDRLKKWSIDDLAALIYPDGSEITPSQVIAVGRAMRKLAQLGKITDLGDNWRFGRHLWARVDYDKDEDERQVVAAMALR